jgi:hypothetical protein
LRANCSKPVYLLGVTENCSICMAALGKWTRPSGLLDQLKAAGADVVLVSTCDANGVSSTPATAEALRKRFALGSRFILAYEPLGRDNFKNFIGIRTNMAGARIALLLQAGNVTAALGQVDDEATIRKALGLVP